jgi:WhiB family redox-sensing transcriptional regulator
MSTDDFRTEPARNCANPAVDAEMFFSASDRQQNLARRICGSCPVQTACLTWALNHGEPEGVWGGVLMSSPREVREARERTFAEFGQPATKDAEQVKSAAQRKAEARAVRDAAVAAEKDRINAEIRKLWGRGLTDAVIALHVGLHPGAINRIRKRLGLATLYGPKGRRLDREQVSA